MSLALNKPKLDNLAGDIWKSAERLRGKFKGYEYQGVILPIIVIRRLECVLLSWRETTRAAVLAKRSGLKENEKELAKLVKGMELGTAPFSNKTDWTLRKVYEEDHALLEENFRAYMMVELLDFPIPDRHFSIYDPASGTGGMLSVSKEHLLDRATTPEEKARIDKFVTVHGQEISPTNYAVCQADLLIKNDRQAKVTLGNSLIPHDPHSKEPGDQWPEPEYQFNRMLSNPPFGVTWGGKDGYEAEARKLEKTRYQAGVRWAGGCPSSPGSLRSSRTA